MQNKTLTTKNINSWNWYRILLKLSEEQESITAIKSLLVNSFKDQEDINNLELIILENTDLDEVFENQISSFIKRFELNHEHIKALTLDFKATKISFNKLIFPIVFNKKILGLLYIETKSNNENLFNLIWSFCDQFSAIVYGFVVDNNAKSIQVNSNIENLQGFLEASLDRLKALEDQNQQLIKLNETRTELINNVSHELRTPLVSIMGFSKILQRREIETSLVLEASEQIQSAGSRLSRMIDDLIQLNRASTQGWQLNVEKLDIGEIGKIVVESLSPLNKNHNFTFNFPDDYPLVEGDRKLLRQVVENLLLNAIKYSPDGGEINLEITVDNKDQLVSFSVHDEGIGMTEKEQKKIFDRFYRAKNPSTENIAGLGLGLSISKDVVEALNGSIECQSEFERGSSFTIKMRY